MIPQDRRRRLIQLAVERFGRDQLARLLDVAPHWIDRGAQGLLSLPERKWRVLAELIDDEGRRKNPKA